MDLWMVSIFSLLWTVLLWTVISYKFLYLLKFLFLLVFLRCVFDESCGNSLFTLLRNHWTLSHPLYHFIFPPADCEECRFSTFIPIYVGSLCCFDFGFLGFNDYFSVHVKWYIIYVSICVSLINNIEHLFIFDSFFF